MKILITACLVLLSVASFAQAKTTTTTTTKPVPAPTAKPQVTTTTTKSVVTTTTSPATTAKPVTATTTKTTMTTATAAKTAPAKPKTIEWADLDLSTSNPPLAVLLKAPKGSTIDYDNGIVIWGADSAYGVVIDMSYGDPPATIAERKKEAVENIIFKLEKFVVDKPDMLLYAVKNRNKLEYHFEIAVEAHGEKYYLHDKWVDGKSFTQKEIEAMAESARGLRAK
ncbi:MAG: hypothetical protein JWO03_2444 [Bacteroidetes bacterium]|nr:hypothetical protein [Bacteroidota bacterium]